jgi:hypothetical protein
LDECRRSDEGADSGLPGKKTRRTQQKDLAPRHSDRTDPEANLQLGEVLHGLQLVQGQSGRTHLGTEDGKPKKGTLPTKAGMNMVVMIGPTTKTRMIAGASGPRVAKPVKPLSQLAQRLQAHGNSAAGLNTVAEVGNGDPP